jgi:hypothetical protein
VIAMTHEANYEPTDEEEERYEAANNLLKKLRKRKDGVDFRLVNGKVRYRPVDEVSEADLAELRRVKAEVIEFLQEEAECEAHYKRRAEEYETSLPNQPETDQLPDGEYEEYRELTRDQQDELVGWIEDNLDLVLAPETEGNRRDSYGFKHVFERSPEGFYVTDAQFRCAMWIAGLLGRRYPRRHNAAPESRYYYVGPNIHGFHRKLVEAGVPSEWSWDVLFRRCPIHDDLALRCHDA